MVIVNYNLKKRFNYSGYIIVLQKNDEFTIEKCTKLNKKR